jgi:hypothetical protein
MLWKYGIQYKDEEQGGDTDKPGMRGKGHKIRAEDHNSGELLHHQVKRIKQLSNFIHLILSTQAGALTFNMFPYERVIHDVATVLL